MASSNVETCLKKKKTHPERRNPLLSYQKSEQLGDTKLHTISKIQTKLLVSWRSPDRSDCVFMEQYEKKKLNVINKIENFFLKLITSLAMLSIK